MDMLWKSVRGVLIVAVYFIVACVALGTTPFNGKTTTPFDILISQRAWHFVNPYVNVRNYHRSDILNAEIPVWEVAKKRLRQGEIPLWNDKVAGGGTLLAVSTNLFTPAFAIFAAIPNSAKGFFWAVLVNLIIAGLGMHVLLRKHVSAATAIAGGASFMLCGFIAAWLYWPHVLVIIWVPWLLAAIDRCGSRPSRLNTFAIAVTSALVCLGGFPFLSVLAMEAGALFALIYVVFRYRQKAALVPFVTSYVAGTMLGLALAALPLIGLMHWLGQFDLGYREGRGSYLDFHYIKQLVPPWAYQARGVEETMYVGMAMTCAAAVAVVALLTRRRHFRPLPTFALALLVISFGLVFGLWPMGMIGWLPGMSSNSWSRAIGLLDIALIIMGCISLQWLWRHRGRHAWTAWVGRAVVIAVILLQIGEMTNFDRFYNGAVPYSYYYPDVPSITYMKQRVGPFDYVITDKTYLMSGTLGAYGLREWLAHYFRTPELQKALHAMSTNPFNTHRASASRFKANTIQYDNPVMARFNVRYIAIDDRFHPHSQNFKRVFQAKGTAVYENTNSPGGPYFIKTLDVTPNAQSGKNVTVLSYQPERFKLKYAGEDAGFLVVPMSWTDEWTVTVNGQLFNVKTENGVMPAVPVHHGDIVRFSYYPVALRYFWAWIAALILLTGVGFAMPWTTRRRRSDKERAQEPQRLPDDHSLS